MEPTTATLTEEQKQEWRSMQVKAAMLMIIELANFTQREALNTLLHMYTQMSLSFRIEPEVFQKIATQLTIDYQNQFATLEPRKTDG